MLSRPLLSLFAPLSSLLFCFFFREVRRRLREGARRHFVFSKEAIRDSCQLRPSPVFFLFFGFFFSLFTAYYLPCNAAAEPPSLPWPPKSSLLQQQHGESRRAGGKQPRKWGKGTSVSSPPLLQINNIAGKARESDENDRE